MRNIKTTIHKYLDGSYAVGIIEDFKFDSQDPIFPKIHWIDTQGYTDGWFADPFIVEVNPDSIILFVEEYLFASSKGRISQIKVNRNDFTLTEVKPILELSSHLSFPYPIKHNDEIYVCPENCADDDVSIYRYNGSNLIEKVKILSGKFVDTQIMTDGDCFYVFTSKISPNSNGGSSILEIYKSKSLLGPYEHFQTIANDKIEERGAGIIFTLEGKTIRPTQDCNDGYGKGVVFNSLCMSHSKFTQHQISRIPANSQYNNGLCFHTFSVFGNLAAVDGFDYPNRFIAKIAPLIYDVKRLLIRLQNR